MKNVLFVCTSNKDRSPALEKYFRDKYPNNEYRSAGINSYFCLTKGTHYLAQADVEWTNFIVFCETIHLQVCFKHYAIPAHLAGHVLGIGDYKQGDISQEYLNKADEQIGFILKGE